MSLAKQSKSKIMQLVTSVILFYWACFSAPQLVFGGYIFYSPLIFLGLYLFLRRPSITYCWIEKRPTFAIGFITTTVWSLMFLMGIEVNSIEDVAPLPPNELSSTETILAVLYLLLFSASTFFLGLSTFVKTISLTTSVKKLENKAKSGLGASILALVLLPIIFFILMIFIALFVEPYIPN